LNGSKLLVLGVAYKKDVDDLRESPTLKIMQLLQGRGAHVEYNDPYFPQLHRMRHYNRRHEVRTDLAANAWRLRWRDYRDGSLDIRLQRNRGKFETRGGYAKCHTRVVRNRDRIVLC